MPGQAWDILLALADLVVPLPGADPVALSLGASLEAANALINGVEAGLQASRAAGAADMASKLGPKLIEAKRGEARALKEGLIRGYRLGRKAAQEHG